MIIDRAQAITLNDILSLSADEYNAYKLDIKAKNYCDFILILLIGGNDLAIFIKSSIVFRSIDP